MHLLFTSYAAAPAFTEPLSWLKRIEGYTGILESLAVRHQVTSIERIDYTGELKQNGVNYVFSRQTKSEVLFPFRIHRLIKKLKPDVVFVNGFIFPLQLLQLRMYLGRKQRIMIINRSEKPYAGIRKVLQRWSDRFVYAYLFPSKEAGLEWVTKGIISGEHKIHEAYHGSSVFSRGDKHFARTKLRITGSPVFLWVGRLDNNKDPLTVIRAFAAFNRVNPGAKFYMIFHEDQLLNDVKALSHQLDLAENLVLVGKADHSDLQDWYNAADYFVSASHYEGGGISVCEAMSCGCVPILTSIPPFRVLTGNGSCGKLFIPGDQVSLLAAMTDACSENLADESNKVLTMFHNHFSFEAIAKKIEAALVNQGRQVS